MSILALALATTLLDIGGGGTDALVPDYRDEVDFTTPAYRASKLDVGQKERLAFYREDVSLKEAYAWLLDEDNREYGLKDVAESFEDIYIGYELDVEDGVIVYVDSDVKSGGIPRLLEAYEVDAEVVIIEDDLVLDQIAFDFILEHGSDDYRSVRPSEDGTHLIVTTSNQKSADLGPVLFGTAFDGVALVYEPAPADVIRH